MSATPPPNPPAQMFFARVWYNPATGQKHYDVYPLDPITVRIDAVYLNRVQRSSACTPREPRAWKKTRNLPGLSMWGACAIHYTSEAALRAAKEKAELS